MKMLLYFLLLTFLFSTPAFAGGVSIIGNGGDVVTCLNPDGSERGEILDLYESKTLLGLTPQFNLTQKGTEEDVKNIILRADIISPRLKTDLLLWTDTFFSESLMLSGVNLVDIPDTDHIVLPKNCRIQQIANQRIPNTPNEKRYVISQDLWNILDHNNQVALILHEIIYRFFLQSGHENSVGARLFNAYLISNTFSTMNLHDRIQLMTRIQMPFISAQGVEIKLYQITDSKWTLSPTAFYEDGTLKMAIVNNNTSLDLFDSKLFAVGPIEFYPNGNIHSLQLSHDVWINYHSQKILLQAGYMELYENGEIKKAFFKTPFYINSHCFIGQVWSEIYLSEKLCPLIAMHAQGTILIHNKFHSVTYGKPVVFFENEIPKSIYLQDTILFFPFILTAKIDFYSTGTPQQGWLKSDQTINLQSHPTLLSHWGLVRFHENGNLKSACLAQPILLQDSQKLKVPIAERSIFELDLNELYISSRGSC